MIQCPRELPSVRLLPGLFLESFAFLLLLGAQLSVAVDAGLEVFDELLQRVAMLCARHAQRLHTTDTRPFAVCFQC